MTRKQSLLIRRVWRMATLRSKCAVVIWATFGLASADAAPLQFSAVADNGDIVSFVLDTAVPNTYAPALYPDLPIRGVYLNAVYDLTFEDTHIALSDVATTPGMTGDGRPLTVMEVGPLFDFESLSLFLVFLDPTLVSPLSSNALAYESSFLPFQSTLFPQIPPPRTHVNPLFSLTVTTVPEPASLILLGAGAVGLVVRLRRRTMHQSKASPGRPASGRTPTRYSRSWHPERPVGSPEQRWFTLSLAPRRHREIADFGARARDLGGTI